jgi:serine/threonine protein kinase/tetratricopeptide (TPR) repeat protein
MQDREERLMGLAREALRTPSAQRESFLRAACHQDQDLYSEVSEIVEWEERMGDFMRDPLVGLIDLEALDRPFKPDQLVADRFEIIREVGDGGMGVVYEAYDRKRQQRIAIKCAKLGYERLSPELRGALKVRHPNVCLVNEIHTASTDLGKLDFLTMEFLDGETLLSRLSRGKLEHNEALNLARQLCAGLAEAHRCGVLHRDLKPANIILASDQNKELRAVITDFGLASDQDGNTDLIGGTPSYMAPELMRDGIASPASDIYALGVILHEVVAGAKPITETSNGDAPAPVAPGKLVRRLPRIWNDAILPCLATQPEKRPSAEQILAVLDRKPVYRRPWVAIAALVLLAAGAFLRQTISEYFRPPDISLAILPVRGSGDLQHMGEGVLHDVTERLAREPRGKPKFRLISPATVQNKGVSTLEQAQSLLHATHALQLELHRDSNGVAVEAAVVDLKSQAHVRDYSQHFSEAELGDLPGGLAGAITASLRLKRAAAPESISPGADAAYKTGRNYLREGRYSFDQAIAQFQQAAQQDAHSPLPQAGLAEAYVFKYRVQNDSQALKQATIHLQAAEKLDSDSPSVRLAAAWLNIFSNKNAQAMEDCSRALEVDPRNSQAWMLCGYLYDIEGIDSKALEYFHKAIALDPTYFRPYQFLGGFYNARAQYAEAEGQYKKEVEFALNDLDGLSDLAGVLTEQGKYAEAEEILRKALKIRATPTSLNDLGATLAFIGRDAEALPYYRQATALEAPNYTYWINIGDAERRLGDSDAAKLAYRKGLALASAHLEINPNSYQARAYMAYIQARLGQNGNARSGIAQAMQSPDKDKQILLCAILTYEALGDREQALKLVNQIPTGMKITIQHHPDLADLRRDLRYIQVTGNSK